MEREPIMMNFGVFGLCHLLKDLAIMEERLTTRVRALNDISASGYANELRKFLNPGLGKWEQVNDLDLEQVRGWLQFATQQANTMELQAVHDRIEIFNRKLLFQPLTLQDLLAEVRTLRETLESGIRFKRFYLYPEVKGQLYVKFEADWRAVIEGFPRTTQEAKAAVDCYALGHNTASVLYSMRVVEHGLRAFASAVNVTFDVQQWHTVIEEIEAAVRDIGKTWPASTAKSAWLSFYSNAAKEFFYFKDGWRNYVSHGGDPYDEHQAFTVLEHVKGFMGHLSSRLGEKTTVVKS
jgi:hypothetical protein